MSCKNVKHLIFLIVFLFPFNFLYSYNDTDTHPDLTVEIVKLFNLQSQTNKFSEEEMELIRRGSILEDTSPRWINHFYNPETGKGWTADNLKGVPQEKVKRFSDWFLSFESPVSSLEWAYNQELQNKYSLYKGNHTFQKAVYDYATGKKEQGLQSLGYILHLIEDASVPDHTRDDTHADISVLSKDDVDRGSPYENWAENYTKSHSLNIAEELNSQNRKYYKCEDFGGCLIKLARYSHYNFFSEDTIREYSKPEVVSFKKDFLENKNIEIGYSLNNNPIVIKLDNNGYTLGKNNPILSSYFYLLSSESTLTGAGVIELFFKEVEKAKNDREYLETMKFKEKQMTLAQSAFAPAVFLFVDKMISPAGEIFRISRMYSGAKNTVKNFASSVVSAINSLFNAPQNQQAGLPILELSGGVNIDETVSFPQIQNQQNQESVLDDFQASGQTNNQTAGGASVNQIQNSSAPSSQNPPSFAVGQIVNKNNNNQTASAAVLNQNQSVQNSVGATPPNFGFVGFGGVSSGYTPGFGGGGAVSALDGNVNSQFPISNFQTANQESGGQNQNSAISTNSENNNQNASSTQNSENSNQNSATSTDSGAASSTQNQIIDTTPPSAPAISFPSDFNQIFTAHAITFEGIAEESSTLRAEYVLSGATTTASTTVSSAGAWELFLNFNEGTTTVDFFAEDASGNTSSSTRVDVFIDSPAPQIAEFKILECETSIAADGCLIATTTVNLLWSVDGDKDPDYFELLWSSENQGQLATTSTSTTLILNEGEHSFSLRAKDKNGNWSESQTLEIEINAKPIVINEVAWAGTGPSNKLSSDEWIELYNRTSRAINLDNFILYASDLKPYMFLQGSILSKGYFLLERTNDETVSHIKADQFFTGALDNQRENLFLVYVSNNSTTTIDYTYSCTDFGHWCGGSINSYVSMERYNPDENIWGTNLMLIKNGKNADYGAIYGTPKTRNSLNYLITPPSENTITKDIILTKQNSPYFVYNTVTVPQDKKLKIEPGVVIKFRSNGSHLLNIFGELDAVGTEDEPIIFTSFYDDSEEAGGDLDGDGGASPPKPGDWAMVRLANNSSSTISYVKFRYGGAKVGMYCCNGMLQVEATSTITNSVFEQSYGYGAQIINSASFIADNIFKNNNNHTQFSGPAGMSIGGTEASPKVVNNIFENNYFGARITGGSKAEFENNVFNNNAGKAMFVSGNDGIGTFKNNSGVLLGGMSDGIYISNLRVAENATTTLYSNSLSYIFHNNPNIPAGSALIVKPNVLIKNDDTNRIEVFGSLITEGVSPSDVVFTSLNDPDESYWFGISANPGSRVLLSGTTIKNGGKITSGQKEKEAALYINESDTEIENSLFLNNYKNGIISFNANPLIKNSEFREHTLPQGGSNGVSYYNSEINLDNVSFRNNWRGLYSDPDYLLGIILAPIIFEGNASTSNIWLEF